MMEFWPENQGQSHLYSKFGTVPGRTYTQNYPDRHQAAQYSLYYGEQQDQSRDQYSYWTVPGSRTAGALHEYTNWTDPEPTAPSSHFPFILDRQTQHHQDMRAYQPQETRDREWTTAYRGTRDYERGFLREGLQRRWDPRSPIRYNREAPAKRSDSSSYRELEAWAARYSHSLPRRRRIEAELRGASQGLGEGSRAPEKQIRSDPRVEAMHSVQQSANFRESGLWDRGGRQQAPTYYPPQGPETSHMLDTKDNTSYQRRTFSQPPGYMAPPPYDSPHKSSPVIHHCDATWDQEGKRQTYWSQPTLMKQDVETRDKRKGEKEMTKLDETKTHTELEGLKHQRQEKDTLFQQPQVFPNPNIIQEISSKVIEGRKFRLNRKTGGMTIFCLVSRIAGTTDTPSLPLCSSQTNIQGAETAEVSEGPRDAGESGQLADEVDFRAPTLPAKEKEACTDEVLKIKAKPSTPTKTRDVDATLGRQAGQSAQPSAVKYPLWREPSLTNRAESESLSESCLKVGREEEEAEGVQSQPIDIEVRRLDIKEDSEDSKGLLVIDTTCVVVKMELIPSPKKEHVHYVGSSAHTEDSPLDTQTTITAQLNEDATADQSEEAASLHLNESPETESDSTLLEKGEHEEESETSFPGKPSPPVPERETLEERAERILGIPLHDCMTEQKPTDETEPAMIKDASGQTPEDSREDDKSQNDLDDGETEKIMCLTDSDREPVIDAGGQDSPECQEHEENDADETDIKTAENPVVESICEKGTSEENQTAEDDQLSHPTDFCDLSSLSDLTPSSYISNTEEGPDPELASLNAAENLVPHPETLPQTSPLPPGTSESSPGSTPHTDRSPSPPPLDLIDQTSEAEVLSEDEEGKQSLPENESFVPEEDVSQLHLECVQMLDAACIIHADEEHSEENLDTPNENGLHGDILQPDCGQTEEDMCLNNSNTTEEQIRTEVDEDPMDLSEQTTGTDEETVNDGQTQVRISQEQIEYVQEEDTSCVEETEDQTQMTLDELWEQTICTNNGADAPTEAEGLQDAEPCCSPQAPAPDSEVSPSAFKEHSELSSAPRSPTESDTAFVSCLDSACLSLNSDADVGVSETDPSPPHLDLSEGSLQCSFSSVHDLPPSSADPALEESLCVPADFPPSISPKEELQYPKSLWDVVNRIRKHTAPDSENEEEEVSELWDPETVGEDLGCSHVAEDMNSEAEHQDMSKDRSEQQVQREEETLSCSSTSSRGSEDTVIVADEGDEVTETTQGPVTECQTKEEDEEVKSAEGEQCCSDDVEDEENENEEQDGEEDTNMSHQTEDCGQYDICGE